MQKQNELDIPFEKKLWRTEDIATYLGMKTQTVRNQFLSLATFPKPFRIAGRGRPLYKAIEVTKWVESFRAK